MHSVRSRRRDTQGTVHTLQCTGRQDSARGMERVQQMGMQGWGMAVQARRAGRRRRWRGEGRGRIVQRSRRKRARRDPDEGPITRLWCSPSLSRARACISFAFSHWIVCAREVLALLCVVAAGPAVAESSLSALSVFAEAQGVSPHIFGLVTLAVALCAPYFAGSFVDQWGARPPQLLACVMLALLGLSIGCASAHAWKHSGVNNDAASRQSPTSVARAAARLCP